MKGMDKEGVMWVGMVFTLKKRCDKHGKAIYGDVIAFMDHSLLLVTLVLCFLSGCLFKLHHRFCIVILDTSPITNDNI